MPEEIRVDVVNTLGETVSTSQTFSSLNAVLKISDRGNLQIGFHMNDSLNDDLGDDYIFRVYYKFPEENIGWTNIFNGINKTLGKAQSQTGRKSVSSHCPSEEDLFQKAHIFYYSGTPQARKSGESSSVIEAYVLENIGNLATVANGRFFDGQNPISTALIGGGGPIWGGSKSQKNLLDVMKEIRDFSISEGDQIDFRCTYQEGYTFLAEIGKIGVDRTANGVTASSKGLNGAGNVPVVLSPNTKNLEQFSISKSRYNEGNVVVSLGPGTEGSRLIGIATNEPSRTASPISQREYVVSATDQATVSDLNNKASSRLNQLVATSRVNAYPRNSRILAFRDYNLGDFVTIEDFDGNRFTRQIKEITVNASKENGVEVKVKILDE